MNQFKPITIVLIAIMVLVMATAIASQGEPTPRQSAEATFPAAWMPAITNAFKDFSLSRSDISCFEVTVRRAGSDLLVSISPPLDLVDDNGDPAIPISPGNSRCGRGIEYHFDNSGRLKKRIIQR
ncbi:MAG: hypothetical protein ACK58T_11235 [Phycisphaerae bacterium]|jgi:hypothetical protein